MIAASINVDPRELRSRPNLRLDVLAIDVMSRRAPES